MVNLELRISPQIFEKFKKTLMWHSGALELIHEKNLYSKISLHLLTRCHCCSRLWPSPPSRSSPPPPACDWASPCNTTFYRENSRGSLIRTRGRCFSRLWPSPPSRSSLPPPACDLDSPCNTALYRENLRGSLMITYCPFLLAGILSTFRSSPPPELLPAQCLHLNIVIIT